MLFSTAIAALLAVAGSAQASDESLRSSRRLSFDLIAGYEPGTKVTDHNAIDLDQAEIQRLLASGTNQDYLQAQMIYKEGAFSKSVATVTLDAVLTAPISKGAAITGDAMDGTKVEGTVFAAAKAGDQDLRIQYNVSPVQSSYVGCQVGANPNPVTDGCFLKTGSLVIGGFATPFPYSYEPEENNDNERTIQGFSTSAETKMRRSEDSPYYLTYQKFYDYYGRFDYADHWVLSAFAGGATSFPTQNGNADFSTFEEKGRVEVIKKGTAYMNVWMYVIREMEDALDDCDKRCDINDCNDDPVKAWDEAVAFYTGSLELDDGSGSGVLLHGLADKRCGNFNTCGDMADSIEGLSHVNIEIFRQFEDGLVKINAGGEGCGTARVNKERIEQLMTVPLVQGTIRYAYIRSTELDAGEKAEAEGAVFAAAVLPVVHACNKDDAAIIYDNSRVGSPGIPNFKAVKEAFERNYECMNIRCADVGGLYDKGNLKFFEGAEPCGSSASGLAFTFGLMATLFMGVTMLF